MRVLVIEDEVQLAGHISRALARHGHAARAEYDGPRGLQAALDDPPDLIVLDLNLPGLDGMSVLARLRQAHCVARVLVLTARGEVEHRVKGLQAGADDYLAKPFEARELLARIKALLRRSRPEPLSEELLRFGRLEIDLGARQARISGKACDLTGHQFDLLVVLAQGAGRVLSRDQIMDALKGHAVEAFDRSIDVHVSRIRACIEDDPKCPKRVLTVRGSGYVFARKQDADE